MSRTNATSLLSMAVLLLMASPASGALEKARIDQAVKAQMAMFYSDDIVQERFSSRAQAADLDGDGKEEILFLATARCVGANFDCPNELVVLVAGPPAPIVSALSPDELALRDAAARTGYRFGHNEQVPGEVERIRVLNRQVEVSFLVKEDSPICKRLYTTGNGEQKETIHCPDPGRYRWSYRWTGGKLVKAQP